MARHGLVLVHDAAGKEAIIERIIRLRPSITFRCIFCALELDRPLLEVKACMLADTPVAQASSIPTSDVEVVVDKIVKTVAQINIPDPMVYVFVAGSKAPLAIAGAPPAETPVQVHPFETGLCGSCRWRG
jgi:hypothetical protein